MSLMLNTGAMQYKAGGSSGWQPLTLVANVDLASLADEFSTSATYAVGEYVRRGGVMYRCTTAVTTAGAWDASDWTEVNIGDELSSLKTSVRKRNYILIGDSFSIGLTTNDGSTYTQVGGWANKFKTEMEAAGNTAYINVDTLSGNSGFASPLPFLTMLQAIETHVTNADDITDIIVLGGTNETGVEANIESAIETFVTYVRSHFQNAHVTVGCIGTNMGYLYNDVAPHYRHISDLGGSYISDLIFLFNDFQYYCYDNLHLTEAGYNFYQPWISEALITGKTSYVHTVTYTLTKTNNDITEVSGPPELLITYAPHNIMFYLNGAANHYLRFSPSYSSGTGLKDVYSINKALRLPDYYHKFADNNVFGVTTNATHLKGMGYMYFTSTTVGLFWNTGSPVDTVSATYFVFYPKQNAVTRIY